MSARTALGLTVNDRRREVLIEPGLTLLELLRKKLRLTGTKEPCSQGECGACAVLVDGEPKLACITLAATCGGKDVTTIEGLSGEKFDLLTRELAACGATQCGFCTPGYVIVGHHLMDRKDDVDFAGEFSGNLCRCTGYAKIIEACERAHDRWHGRPVETREQVQPRVDALEKIRGQATFVDDLEPPGTLVAMLKRSPHPHAVIESIDASAALAIEGVTAVLRGEDLTENYGVLPVTQDETALAQNKVRYVGEPVAAVCAETAETAARALEAIEVHYRPLEPILSVEQALNSDIRIHDSERFEGNAHRRVALEFGDVARALASCDYVREDVFHYAGNTHLPMEPHATLAQWDGHKLTLDVSHQSPDNIHRILPKVLGIPDHALRVRIPYVGGGFGGKLDVFPDNICAAKFALMTGRPVKATLSREEVFYNHRGRHPVTMRVTSGWDDGALLAVHFENFLDGGAYASYGVASTYYTGTHQPVTYDIPNYKVDAVRCYTNKPPCGPKRGHGMPQPRFALEAHLDKVAEDLGDDPVELRRRIANRPNSVAVNAIEITTCGISECIDRVLKASDFTNLRATLPAGEGIGFALSSYVTGAALPLSWNDMPHTEVEVTADRNGKISAMSSHTEIGQGSDNVLATIVARTLGIDPPAVDLVLRDSDRTPADLGSYSSRVTMMMGNAALEAATKLADTLRSAAGERLSEPVENLVLEDGAVRSRRSGAEMSLKEAIVAAKSEGQSDGVLAFTGSYRPPPVLGRYKGAGVGPSPADSFTACVVHVAVDLDTGLVTPRKVWIAHDIGRCIHRTAVEGQVEGGVYMGLCEVLMEATEFSEEGLLTNVGFLDYKTLTSADMPPVETHLVETADPRGPFGAKEVGQGPLLPVIPAVANAVYDAIGVRFDTFPITADLVRRAIERGVKRVGPDTVPDFDFGEPVRVVPYEGVEVERSPRGEETP